MFASAKYPKVLENRLKPLISLKYRKQSTHSHNPKVEGSSPSPATKKIERRYFYLRFNVPWKPLFSRFSRFCRFSSVYRYRTKVSALLYLLLYYYGTRNTLFMRYWEIVTVLVTVNLLKILKVCEFCQKK